MTVRTSTVYDELGKPKERHDKLGYLTAYAYDDMGRLAVTTFPDLTTEQFAYDGEGTPNVQGPLQSNDQL